MKTDERTHEWAGHAAAFALDALDGEERVAFEKHLASCETCEAEVHAFREVALQLAFSVPVREPPATLRQRVLDTARAVRPLHASPARDRTARPPERSSFGHWLAAASVGIALIALAAYMSERNDRIRLEHTLANLDSAATARDTELAELRTNVAQRDSLLATVLSPAVQTTQLTATGRPPSARIYLNRRLGRIVISAAALDPAPSGRTYQLWGIANGSAISLGIFNTRPDGTATISLQIDPLVDFQAAGVTEEPEGGSAQPTAAPFLVGELR
jgi:anti-sigma-K factor RskA